MGRYYMLINTSGNEKQTLPVEAHVLLRDRPPPLSNLVDLTHCRIGEYKYLSNNPTLLSKLILVSSCNDSEGLKIFTRGLFILTKIIQW